MRQFAVLLFLLAAASASPQNLKDRIKEGLMQAKEGLENAGADVARAIQDSPLGEVLNSIHVDFVESLFPQYLVISQIIRLSKLDVAKITGRNT